MPFRTKRIYDDPARDDGYRVLVDRLWARGLKKEDAKLDEWLKEVAPSNELRKWFHHETRAWEDFRKRYFAELDQKPDLVGKLRELATGRTVTLLYSGKDTERNNAVALQEYLEQKAS